LKIIINQ